MKLKSAIEGYCIYCGSLGLKKETIYGRKNRLKHLLEFTGDVEIETIDNQILRTWLVWLKKDFITSKSKRISKRGIAEHFFILKMFYKWASTNPEIAGYGLGILNQTEGIKPPKFETVQVDPFNEKEIKAILKAVKPIKPTKDKSKRLYISRLGFEAAIFTMLDVGLRRGEICRLKVADWQASTGRLHIIQGKGEKDRFVFVGSKTQHAIWFYLENRQPKRITEPLFATNRGKEYNHDYFRQKINQLGKEANVENCYPHRFRHTCALLRIKNGETAESLQHLLGHTTPKMAMYYVKLAALDLEEIQKNASPVDNL